GLDHVLSMRRNINLLVLDTEVYSNTGGQASKSTPIGAAAKFAAAGKATQKKDLGLMAMSYGHAYVASVALRAKGRRTVQALPEARQLGGAVAGHPLQPRHRPRLRPALRGRAAEAGGQRRRLAALPLRPAPRRARRAAAGHRRAARQGRRRRLHA